MMALKQRFPEERHLLLRVVLQMKLQHHKASVVEVLDHESQDES